MGIKKHILNFNSLWMKQHTELKGALQLKICLWSKPNIRAILSLKATCVDPRNGWYSLNITIDVCICIYIYTPFQPSNNCTCFFWWGWRETKIIDKYDNDNIIIHVLYTCLLFHSPFTWLFNKWLVLWTKLEHLFHYIFCFQHPPCSTQLTASNKKTCLLDAASASDQTPNLLCRWPDHMWSNVEVLVIFWVIKRILNTMKQVQ